MQKGELAYILGKVITMGEVHAVADSSTEAAASHARRLGELLD